ncbi:CRAL/TRIO domain-containing protein [Atractiella rhizophila]|nr:CRAL/TRIO domain-containing protein [Atractiella rhizophila]
MSAPRTVYTTPSPSSTLPPLPPPLTPSQKAIYARLLARVSEPDFILPHEIAVYRKATKASYKKLPYALLVAPPASGGGEEGEKEKWTGLREEEKAFLTREQLERVLRSVKWDEGKAIARLEETLVWRREYIDTIEGFDTTVEPESESGKMYILGYDTLSRPCLYMHPYRQNTTESPRQIQFLVYQLEACIALMPPHCESLCICIDFGSKKGVKSNPTSVNNSLQTLTILQNYYVERLGKAIGIDLPWLFGAFWKVVSPFVDPVSKSKIVFNATDLDQYVPPDQREKSCFGGTCAFEYDHATYWSDLTKKVAERKAEMFNRWKELGGKIGEEEWRIRGGSPREGMDVKVTDEKATASKAVEEKKEQVPIPTPAEGVVVSA